MSPSVNQRTLDIIGGSPASTLQVFATVALVAPSSLDEVFPLYAEVMQRWGGLVSAFEGISRAALEAGLHGQDVARWFDGQLPDYAMLIELSSELPAEQLALGGLLQGWLEQEFETGRVRDAVLDAD